MNVEELIELMKKDLQNEVYHMMFYLWAASRVEGIHREELSEFFMKEAHEEMGHVHEFMNMISYLGCVVNFMPQACISDFSCDPYNILAEVVRMEQEVATNYAARLKETEGSSDPAIATAHVFYEDQIKNSQMTSWEVKKWLTRFSNQ